MPLPLPCLQNLLRVGSALLDMGNKRHWELIQQTEGGTAQLLRHFEEYARALARNMPQTYLSPFTIVTPNIGQWGHAWLEGCEADVCLGTKACWEHVICVCLGTYMCPWYGTGDVGMDVRGDVCTGDMDMCVLGDMCVLRGCVCVGDMDTCLGAQTYTHTDVCAQGHVCWEHACVCDVYLGTRAGDTDICMAGKHVLGNMGVPRGMCMSLCGLCIPGLVGAGVSGCQDPWPLGSVGIGIHGPGFSGYWGPCA